LAASRKFLHNIVHTQYYANEVCKTCASVARLVASFIVVVIWVLQQAKFFVAIAAAAAITTTND